MNEEAGNSNQGEARFFFLFYKGAERSGYGTRRQVHRHNYHKRRGADRMPKDAKPSYRIHVHPGKENREHIMDELAKQVIQRNVVDFHMQNERVKKIPLPGRAG
ncbi:hypothetical protein BVG16_05830 [Paenibacillus selenitireducens]|uniref:Uncharacterized protein n=1 Tax=Paenibacillus selenitireducens TaxID=1324314 RepID=A0A1T2XKJ4_9BACL|nr:hypothetical protein [Paenibacillus selenitireducens]OPA80256.1 hypothetical protein BVG16_05830 [Paenibacillus selenitireducens]